MRFVDGGDLNREILLDPVMLRAAGDVRGIRICDIGCGEGRFCRKLAERGGIVTGVDPTRPFIEAARKRHPKGEYFLAAAESLAIESETFDLVTSYVSLIDIVDFRAGIREMTRILKPGGALLVANLNGHATANMFGWTRNGSGEKAYFAIDHYLQERAERVKWHGIDVENYHRPLSAYMEAFLAAELNLELFEEPAYSDEAVRADPDLAFDNRVPLFVVMRWRKPVGLNTKIIRDDWTVGLSA